MLSLIAGIKAPWARFADRALVLTFLLLLASYANLADMNQAVAGLAGLTPLAIPGILGNLFAVGFLSALFVTVWVIVSNGPRTTRTSDRDGGAYSGSDAGGPAHGDAVCGDGACGGDGGGGGE